MALWFGVFVKTESPKFSHGGDGQWAPTGILQRDANTDVEDTGRHGVLRNGTGDLIAVAGLRHKWDHLHPDVVGQFKFIDAFLFHQDFEAPVAAKCVHQAADGAPLELHVEALVCLDEAGNGVVAFPAGAVVVAFPKGNRGAAFDLKGIGVGQFFFEEELSGN